MSDNNDGEEDNKPLYYNEDERLILEERAKRKEMAFIEEARRRGLVQESQIDWGKVVLFVLAVVLSITTIVFGVGFFMLLSRR